MATKKLRLVVADEKPENVKHAETVEVTLVDKSLSTQKPMGARLCGGTSTCLALMHTD